MPTIQEYFQNDFKDMSLDATITLNFGLKNLATNEVDHCKIDVKQRILQGMDSSARLFTFYIPETPHTFFVCKIVVDELHIRKQEADDIVAIGGFSGDRDVGIHSIVWSNRVFIYTEMSLTDDEVNALHSIASEKKLYLTIRSKDYLKKRMDTQKPLAFISHDSNDKDSIARPIANGLNSRLCFVWYDEFSLKIGDSLRESIEKGIKEAKKCVLIITPDFLNNPGWTKKEFNSIFTRELIFDEKVVLPIWSNVSKEDVFNYSPSLADTYALTWPSSIDLSENDYKGEVEKVISKLHTAITANNSPH